MSQKTQSEKNIKLTHKFISYLLNADNLPDFPKDISFVPFSNEDIQLNKANEQLLSNLISSETPVAKVEEPEDDHKTWKIIPINF